MSGDVGGDLLDDVVQRVHYALGCALVDGKAKVKILSKDARALIRCAQLLKDIHRLVESGNVDFINLEWLVDADELIVGPKDGEDDGRQANQ